MQEEELSRRADPAITLMVVGLLMFVVLQVVTFVPYPFGQGQLTCAAVWLFVCGAVWRRLLNRRQRDSQ